MSDNYRDFEALADNRSAQVIQIEQGKSMSVVALVMSAAALVGVFILAISQNGQSDDMRALMQAEAKAASATAVVRANDANANVRILQDDLQKRGLIGPLEMK